MWSRISSFMFAALLVLGAAPHAAAADEAQGYRRIADPPPAAQTGKIEVVEFFWYGCPHCDRMETQLRTWLQRKPADVSFERMPAVLRTGWMLHARAHYTAETLGVLPQLHPAIFSAIHRERRLLKTDDDLRKFFVDHSIDATRFDETYGSRAVEDKVQQAMQLTQHYQLTGVPAFVVNGKYVVDAESAGGFSRILEVVDRLIERERGGG